MIIFVIDSRNRILSPTMREDWAEKQVKLKKARFIRRKLIILKLNYAVTSTSRDTYSYSVGLDTGYSHVGFCVVKLSKSKVLILFKGEVELRTSEITKLLKERKMYRNIRRRNRRTNCKFKSLELQDGRIEEIN